MLLALSNWLWKNEMRHIIERNTVRKWLYRLPCAVVDRIVYGG